MPIKKKLIKELLIILDGKSLKDLTEKEVEKIAEEVSSAVVRTVPTKDKERLKIVKSG